MGRGYLPCMVPATISPECQLVFRSADPACDRSTYAALAREVEDWPRVFALAERELATLGLFRGLSDAEVPVPAEALNAIRKSALQTDLRMQQLARRLQHSVNGLEARGIPCLLLKGAAVGALTDPTLRARPMTDLDILVHREDAPRASEALLEAGWSVTTNPVYLEVLKDAHHLPHFVDPSQPGIRLELHVSLMPDDQPFTFDEAMLWHEARPAPPPFAGALVPQPEQLALHSCLHFAWQHMLIFGAWRTFRSVSELARLPGFDWNRFAILATEGRAGTACYWTLRLAHCMSGVAVPPEILERLAAPTPEWAQAALERHFIAGIAPGEGPASPSARLTRWLWRAALRPGSSRHIRRGRGDRDRRWVEALGEASTETLPQRLARHVVSYRTWVAYLSRTLLR